MEIIKVPSQYIVYEGYCYGTLRYIKKKLEADKNMLLDLKELKAAAERLIDKIRTKKSFNKDIMEITEIHKMILADPFLWSEIEKNAKNGKISIESLLNVRDKIIELLINTGNPLIIERQYDIKDIFNALIKEIVGEEKKELFPNDVVYVEEVYPSDIIELYKSRVGAILSKKGSHTSHAAILAMSLEIPYIYNVPELDKYDGHSVFVDAVCGRIIIDPSPDKIKGIKRIIEKYQEEKEELKQYSKLQFKDIKVMANIGFLQEIDLAKKKGADGIGLFRTEFLFLNRRSPPSEEEQFLIYKRVLESFYPNEVTIRLLDIGGDKQISYLDMPKEENPFLGVRGIRLLLKNKELLITQLKALIRASKYGNLKILIPMVTVTKDVIEVRKLLEKLKKYVNGYGEIKLGIMVEVPAVIFNIEEFTPYIDFVSIGTNDLTQYLFAADRNNVNVSSYYNDESKIVLSAINMAVNKLSKANIPVSICGELAGKAHIIEKLLEIGIRELSVAPSKIPKIKKQIAEFLDPKASSRV